LATAYKILGQVNPTSGVGTNESVIYSVNSNVLGSVISTITVCNTSSNTATYNIAVRQGGATLSTKQYIAYGASVAAGETITYTLGITLAPNDLIGAYSTSTGLAFQAFGSELS